jgi:hypothetical protein
MSLQDKRLYSMNVYKIHTSLEDLGIGLGFRCEEVCFWRRMRLFELVAWINFAVLALSWTNEVAIYLLYWVVISLCAQVFKKNILGQWDCWNWCLQIVLKSCLKWSSNLLLWLEEYLIFNLPYLLLACNP